MSVTFAVKGKIPNWSSKTDIGYVNLSNANARNILSMLSVHDEDLCGSMNAPAFRHHCLMAIHELTVNGDPAIPDVVEEVEGQATVIYCGEPANSNIERLQRLVKLTHEAKSSQEIAWG